MLIPTRLEPTASMLSSSRVAMRQTRCGCIKSMIDLVRKAHDSGRLLAAICHGPQLLISAEVVRGRKATLRPSIAIDLENAGALWFDEVVIRDGNLITSRQPCDIPEFNAAIIEALQGQESKRHTLLSKRRG